MLPRNHPDRIRIVFDDHRLVANAGLLLPATLARHLGLRELVDHHLDLGGAPGRANTGDKLMTLVASAMAGGDCIDDADVLRTGGTACTLGGTVKAPSTLGTFLRSFRWGHVRQLDRVSRELLARAWAAGAGPGDGPLTIDLDSTICETYGLAKEGARHHGYTGKRGYHPLLAIAAGTGDVLMSRLREGRANTARGAAHFLRETVGRVRYAGANGRLTLRADSGFYTHGVVSVCRKMGSRPVKWCKSASSCCCCLGDCRLREIGLRKSFVEGQNGGCEVSTSDDPFVVLLSQDGANEAAHGRPVREDAHHIGASPDLLVETLLWVVGPELLPVGELEAGEGQDVGSRFVQ